MARRGGNWRLGLLPLAVLWLGANAMETGRIEADLAGRAHGALEASGGVARVDGRDVTLAGEFEDARARGAALAGVAAVEGVRQTVDASSLRAPPQNVAAKTPPPAAPERSEDAAGRGVVAPYLFHADLSAGKLTMSGFFPDLAAHARILGAAARAFPERDVVDEMRPGTGAPPDFVDAAVAGLGQLARLREGALDLRDRAAFLRGEAARADVADDIRASLVGALPGGFAVESQLTGSVRDSAPSQTVENAPVKPPAKAQTPEQAGAPPIETHTGARETKAGDRSSGETGAPACAARIAALVERRPIDFASGRAQLTVASARTLDAVAAQAKSCPDVNFEIAGHTDDVGYVSENRELSRRRAENVLVYLVSVGVSPKRLTAMGYGEARPLVPNDNDENRAKNRRIEFNPKQGRAP